MRFLLRVIATAIATWLVSLLLPGIDVIPFGNEQCEIIASYLAVAFAFGVINATVGTAIRIVAFPLYLLTLGLASFFVNGLLLMMVHWISTSLGWGLQVDTYWWGILGAFLIAVITSIITAVTSPLLNSGRTRRDQREWRD